MHKLANDINLLELTLAIKLGESPQIEIKKNEPCAVLELFPKQAGIFAGIANEDQLKQLPSLQYYKIRQPLGNHVGKAGDGYKMCAVIILHNSDYDQFNRDLNYINKSCFVKTS